MEKEVCTFRNEDFLPHVIAVANKGKKVRIPLRGFSMRPFLEDNRDSAVLEKIDGPLKVGDVVLSELPPHRYALHRLIMVGEDKVQMLGDGNLTPDPIIPLSAVKLKAYSFYRKGRNRQDFVDGWKFRTYSKIWMWLRPYRRYLLFIYRRYIWALNLPSRIIRKINRI